MLAGRDDDVAVTGPPERSRRHIKAGRRIATRTRTVIVRHDARRYERRRTPFRGPEAKFACGTGQDRWTPRELRTTFVSLLSHRGVAIEEIARLAGHASTRTTEIVYRRELRPVITTEIMDEVFGSKLALRAKPESC